MKAKTFTKKGYMPRQLYSSLLLYIFYAVVLIGVIGCKKNLHIDEILTYGLSNDAAGKGINIEEGVTYEPAEIGFINYFTVSPDHRFDYKSVWRNQAGDVHPPLYYAVVHTICSLLPPGRFSKWSAGCVNIICMLIILYISSKIAEEFVQSRFYLKLMQITFILCAGMLSSVSFFRMYVMAMLWVSWFTYLLIHFIGRQREWKLYFCIFIAALGGALTHYYCIVYMFFICVVYGILLLYEKRWKDTACFVGTMTAAGGVSLLIFPAMLEHVLHSYRGEESAENLRMPLSEYWERIKTYYRFFDTQVFGGLFLIIVCFGVILAIAVLGSRSASDQSSWYKGMAVNKRMVYKWLLLGLPGTLYFLLVAKISVYIADRYIFPIYAVAFLFFTLFIICAGERLFYEKSARLVVCALFSVLIIYNFKNISWNYICKYSEPLLNEAEKHKDVDCICIYEAEWKILPIFYEISHYKSVTFIKDSSQETLSQFDLTECSELMVIMENEMSEENIMNIIELYPNLNSYEKTGGFAYTSTWYLHEE